MGMFDNIVSNVGAAFGNNPIGTIIGAAGTIIGAREMSRGQRLPPEVIEAARRQNEIAAALADPNSELLRSTAADIEGQDRRDFATALNDLAVRNRRAMARTGGLGILNPERRDEAIAGAAARGFADIKDQARTKARSFLASALQANGAVAGAFQPIMENQQQRRQGRLNALDAILTQGANLFGGRQSQGYSFGGGGTMLNGNPNQLTINLRGVGGSTGGGVTPSIHGN